MGRGRENEGKRVNGRLRCFEVGDQSTKTARQSNSKCHQIRNNKNSKRNSRQHENTREKCEFHHESVPRIAFNAGKKVSVPSPANVIDATTDAHSCAVTERTISSPRRSCTTTSPLFGSFKRTKDQPSRKKNRRGNEGTERALASGLRRKPNTVTRRHSTKSLPNLPDWNWSLPLYESA